MFVTSDKCRQCIASWEGCILTAYKATPYEKYFTIGYGHSGEDVKESMTITQEQADGYMIDDLKYFENDVTRRMGNRITKQNEFDALVSYAYNVGSVYKLSQCADTAVMLELMLSAVRSGTTVYRGLQRRRICEVRMYLDGEYKTNVASADYAKYYTASGAVIKGCLSSNFDNALAKLTKHGIINSPDYWKLHKNDMQYLELLITNIASKIHDNAPYPKSETMELDIAIEYLRKQGVVNSPAYWRANAGNVKFLDLLIIRSALVLGAKPLTIRKGVPKTNKRQLM